VKRHLALVTLAATAACGTSHQADADIAPRRTEVLAPALHIERAPEAADPTEGLASVLDMHAARALRPRSTRSTRQRSTVAASSRAAHPSAGGSCTLAVIRQRESGGDYTAVSSSGKYRGAYQFDARTWASVGGTGDPAAASPEEQDARAAELLRRRGTQPWSVC
jgi:hypothetical protein